MSAPIEKVGIGDTAVGVFVTDVAQTVVPISQRESLEQDGVGHCEDGGVDADADCEHNYSDGCESGILEQGSDA